MTVHQSCPFCDRRFEIGSADYRPMERHIRLVHSNRGNASETTTVREHSTEQHP